MALTLARSILPAALALGLAACAPARPPTAAPAAPADASAPTSAQPAGAATTPPAPITVKVADSLSGTLAGLYIGKEKGYFAEEGLDVETVRFPSLEPQIAPLGTNEIDVGQGGFVPGMFNAIARGIPLRMVATAAVHAPGRSQLIVARKDLLDSGQLADYASLRGKTISRPASFSIATLAIDKALKQGGVSDDDVNWVTLGFPDAVAALGNKGIDLGYLSEPFATSVIEQGIAGKWHEMADLVPNHPASIWVYAPRLTQDQPDAGRRFMTALLRGVREYEDAFTKNVGRAEVVATLIRNTGIKDPALYDRMTIIRLPPSGETNVQALQEDLDWLVEKGAVTQAPPLSEVLDTRFTDYAVQQLGPYRE
ncbi:MAG TPA: ABC transporter substrate-binding protein [Chloroflexota bacterium]|nr:ABC transporter substrate-binding protein [Chloroflexota bacterium]